MQITLNLFKKSQSGTITSKQHDEEIHRLFAKIEKRGVPEDDLNEICYDSALHGIESMILAHACAGIDVKDPKYVEGIKTAMESCDNNWS